MDIEIKRLELQLSNTFKFPAQAVLKFLELKFFLQLFYKFFRMCCTAQSHIKTYSIMFLNVQN